MSGAKKLIFEQFALVGQALSKRPSIGAVGSAGAG